MQVYTKGETFASNQKNNYLIYGSLADIYLLIRTLMINDST